MIILLIILYGASAAILWYDGHKGRRNGSDKTRSLQRYVHGFGLGASINPKWGFISFDPRIDAVDETALFPVPGSYSYSPDRGLSVVDIKEITLNDKRQ